MSDGYDWFAEPDEVLLHKPSCEIWHVSKRLNDVDNDSDEWPEMHRYYHLWDATHTTDQYWSAEDLRDCFHKIGETVSGKPVNAEELEYWFD